VTDPGTVQSLAIVIPVYQGEHTLERVVEEILSLDQKFDVDGTWLEIAEIVVVHDGAVDDSASVIEALAARHPTVQPVWLSRNFGQHPAVVAGIASTSTDWIVTMDEDGLHDPRSIADMVRTAHDEGADLVYGTPSREIPHPWYRNLTSALAKRCFRLLTGSADAYTFTSYRLVDGVIARSLAAYYGEGIYLDVALTWVVGATGYQAVEYRPELRQSEQRSGYDLHRLLSHFRRLVVSSGTRPLRAVAAMGILAMLGGIVTAVVVALLRIFGDIPAQGWASVMIAMAIFSGLILTALGVIAEYLSVAISMASGRPPYLTIHRPPHSHARRR